MKSARSQTPQVQSLGGRDPRDGTEKEPGLRLLWQGGVGIGAEGRGGGGQSSVSDSLRVTFQHGFWACT